MLREALCLCLGADEDGDAENDATQAEEQSAFAVRQEAQGDVKGRRHGSFGSGGMLTIRCRTGCPGRSLSWLATTTRLPSERPLIASAKSRVRNPTWTVRERTMPRLTINA